MSRNKHALCSPFSISRETLRKVPFSNLQRLAKYLGLSEQAAGYAGYRKLVDRIAVKLGSPDKTQ